MVEVRGKVVGAVAVGGDDIVREGDGEREKELCVCYSLGCIFYILMYVFIKFGVF